MIGIDDRELFEHLNEIKDRIKHIEWLLTGNMYNFEHKKTDDDEDMSEVRRIDTEEGIQNEVKKWKLKKK